MSRSLKVLFLLLFAVLAAWSIDTLLSQANDEVFRVVLDAGHGGHDPGAVTGESYEKDIDLAVALLVKEQLSGAEGVEVILTREEDVFLELVERAGVANDARADLFVSIHSNAIENDDTFAGIYTFHHERKTSGIAPAEAIQAAVVAATGAIDRGVRGADYTVLKETDMPAVLVELGFMTCPEELEKLTDPAYQTLLAQGIAEGILACRGK